LGAAALDGDQQQKPPAAALELCLTRPTTEEIRAVVEKIHLATPVGSRAHLEAIKTLRQFLSNIQDPPYHDIVQAGAVSALITALQPPQVDAVALETIFEAAWALTNLAVGEAHVVKAVVPAAPILIAYVEGGSGLAVAEQCAWALGNIAGEDAEYRAVLIANGAVRPLTKLFVLGTKAAIAPQQREQQPETAMQEDKGSSLPVGGEPVGPEADLDQRGDPAVAASATAAWALSNLLRSAGHDETGELMGTEGAAEALIRALDCPFSDRLSIETAWLVGHLTAANSVAHLNRLLHLGLLGPLCSAIERAEALMMEETVAVGATGGSPPSGGTIAMETTTTTTTPMIGGEGAAKATVQMENNEMSALPLSNNENICYESRGRALLTPLLRVLGNVVAGGGNASLSELLTARYEGAIKAAVVAAESRHHGLQREAAWVLGNVAGVPGEKGIAVLRRIGALPVLMALLKEQPFHVRKEAAFALLNVVAGGGGGSGDAEAMNYLFGGDREAVRSMVSLMRSADSDVALMGLQFAEMLLRLLPSGVAAMESADGIDALEVLQFGAAGGVASEVSAAAAHLVDKYWGAEGPGSKMEGEKDGGRAG
jgi:importin subunit alpha-6/7